MQKITLLTIYFLLFFYSFSYGQNTILDCQFDGNLLDNSAISNSFTPSGSGSSVSYANGHTSNAPDSSLLFVGGKGVVTSNSVDNRQWMGCAMSIWVKNIKDGTVVAGAFMGFGIFIDNDKKVKAFFDGSSAGALASKDTLTSGVWHHIVAQNNGDTSFLYINGVLDTFQVEPLYTPTTVNNNAKVYLGITNLNLNKLEGQIDNFKLYDGILSENQITNLTTIDVIPMLQDIRVYPNPSTHQLTVGNIPPGENQIRIFDTSGRQVLEKNIINDTITIGINHLKSGVYFLAIFDEDNHLIARQQIIKK